MQSSINLPNVNQLLMGIPGHWIIAYSIKVIKCDHERMQ